MIQIPEGSIVRATLRALIAPKRLAPMLLVASSLVFAQVRFSRDPLALPLGILMCLVFVAVAPVSYRVLFPEGLDFSHGGVRLVLYAAVGSGVVLSTGYVLPKLLRMGPTFLTQPVNLAVCGALYLVADGDWAATSASRSRWPGSEPRPPGSSWRRSRHSSWRCAATWIRTSSSTR
jgi:hypothetical protein